MLTVIITMGFLSCVLQLTSYVAYFPHLFRLQYTVIINVNVEYYW